jgi:hypothetical protein
VVHPCADRHAAALEEGHLQNEIQLHSFPVLSRERHTQFLARLLIIRMVTHKEDDMTPCIGN